MTIAEIHGKLRPHECSEDLLTSDVFGSLRYCLPNQGLIPFMRQAVPFEDPSGQPIQIDDDIDSAEYFFWPRTTNREPDLIIILKSKKMCRLAINIEAKYLSFKHNKEDTEVTFGTLSGDQLISQYQEFTRDVPRYNNSRLNEQLSLVSNQNRYLVFLTMHYVLPTDPIMESIDAARERNLGSKVNMFYWLSWSTLPKVIDNNGDNLVLSDLLKLLVVKKIIQLDAWNIPSCSDVLSRYGKFNIYKGDDSEYWCDTVSPELIFSALTLTLWD